MANTDNYRYQGKVGRCIEHLFFLGPKGVPFGGRPYDASSPGGSPSIRHKKTAAFVARGGIVDRSRSLHRAPRRASCFIAASPGARNTTSAASTSSAPAACPL